MIPQSRYVVGKLSDPRDDDDEFRTLAEAKTFAEKTGGILGVWEYQDAARTWLVTWIYFERTWFKPVGGVS